MALKHIYPRIIKTFITFNQKLLFVKKYPIKELIAMPDRKPAPKMYYFLIIGYC